VTLGHFVEKETRCKSVISKEATVCAKSNDKTVKETFFCGPNKPNVVPGYFSNPSNIYDKDMIDQLLQRIKIFVQHFYFKQETLY